MLYTYARRLRLIELIEVLYMYFVYYICICMYICIYMYMWSIIYNFNAMICVACQKIIVIDRTIIFVATS